MIWILILALILGGCAVQSPPASWVDPAPEPEVRQEYYVDYANSRVLTGRITTSLASEDRKDVSFRAVYPGRPGRDYTDPAVYTRRDFMPATTGLKWAPHTWETADDRYVLELLTAPFYSFLPDTAGTGYTVFDEMAQGLPQDVTAQYAGSYGIAPGDTARAWRVRLNPDACWENGEKINADTYVYSYRELLDPKMKNRRADSLYAGDFAIVGARDYLYGKASWDQVGILKTGEYELVFITAAPVASPSFYVPYYLSATYLVYAPLWESCKRTLDENNVSTTYGTSRETTMSYGPYRLTYFERDKRMAFTRNESWHGYADGRHLGQYQTDHISCQVIGNHATALLSFLGGELDEISLESADMERYGASEFCRYEPETYTTKLTFNTDLEALSKRGTQVLSNPLFRKAFALSIDRNRFASAYTSAGEAGFGLLNEVYVYDPFTSGIYRHTEAAQNALVQLHRLPENLGMAAITGYQPSLARALMQRAYTQCVEAGLYDGESQIRLQISVYQSQDIYVQMYHFLSDALEKATEGTGFAGKVELTMAVDADYYATMESGLTDIIFSTWGGSAFDPYGVLYQCYCDPDNQMEYGFDAKKVQVDMVIDGETCQASLYDWARYCIGDAEIGGLAPFRRYDGATQAAIYANLEYAYLSQYAVTPLYYRNAARLQSRKGSYGLEQYHALTGFGGLAFYYYHYDDAAWEQVKAGVRY